jgi:hypothetical protein
LGSRSGGYNISGSPQPNQAEGADPNEMEPATRLHPSAQLTVLPISHIMSTKLTGQFPA